jgi:uncharacterized protein (TIGR03083 family)
VEIWDAIAAERRALADTLDGLDEDAWSTPSLCSGWTVREVAAHLSVPFRVSTPRLVLEIARSRFSFNRAMDRLAREGAALPSAELIAAIRDNATNRFTPPGLGPSAPLTDAVIHGLDIRRPLGLQRVLAPEVLAAVLDFVTSRSATRGFIPRGRLAGLRLSAVDIERSWGQGAEVSGPAEDVALAATGRVVGLQACVGNGVEILASRLN